MNTRKDNNGKALAAWKKLRVGHIAKPLRHIRNRAGIFSHLISDAEFAANRGDGLTVQRMALSLK